MNAPMSLPAVGGAMGGSPVAVPPVTPPAAMPTTPGLGRASVSPAPMKTAAEARAALAALSEKAAELAKGAGESCGGMPMKKKKPMAGPAAALGELGKKADAALAGVPPPAQGPQGILQKLRARQKAEEARRDMARQFEPGVGSAP